MRRLRIFTTATALIAIALPFRAGGEVAVPAVQIPEAPKNGMDVKFETLTGYCNLPSEKDATCAKYVAAVYTALEIDAKEKKLGDSVRSVDAKYDQIAKQLQTDQSTLRADLTKKIADVITDEMIRQITDAAVKEAKRQIIDDLKSQGIIR
jgi:hypothetical protein